MADAASALVFVFFFLFYQSNASAVDAIFVVARLPGFKNLRAGDSVQRTYLEDRRPLATPPATLLAPRDDLCTRPNSTVELGPNGSPLLVVLSHSPTKDFTGRQKLRSRWDATGATAATPRAFLLGRPSSPKLDTALRAEAEQYGDLIVFDVDESYYSLAAKTSGLLRWIRESCPNPYYILRWDADDTPVNFFLLRRLLRERIARGEDPLKSGSLGLCYIGTPPMRRGKWAMPVTTWPFDTYPSYPVGPFSLMTGEMAAKFESVSLGLKDEELLYNDVQIGMLGLAGEVEGCTSLPGIYHYSIKSVEELKEKGCQVLAVHPATFIDKAIEFFQHCEHLRSH